ncbi:aggregation-promoting factor [Streptococcus orisasini]|uniref:aggregation-promoting factor n=1 Tax=Streptococcus orisasini TaxID=1080071 RepID=UPI00070F5C4C|nr:LysM peptidoglycan-binding domain-containing protein [Streptococcus orisasini]
MSIKNILENKTVKTSFAGLATAASLILPIAAHAESYTVKSGDTLSEIASAHGTTVKKLAKINKIKDVHLIYTDQVLELDEKEAASSPATEAAPAPSSETQAPAASETTQATETTVQPSSAETQASEAVTPAATETQVSEATTTVTSEVPQTTEATTAPAETQASEATTAAPATTQVSEAATTATEAPQTTEATTAAPAESQTAETASTSSSLSASDAAAKEFIAQKESGGNYNAQNGQYYGRYQLSSSYLKGDLSAENQERVADAYVTSRYGSWTAAQAFWNANGWY